MCMCMCVCVCVCECMCVCVCVCVSHEVYVGGEDSRCRATSTSRATFDIVMSGGVLY